MVSLFNHDFIPSNTTFLCPRMCTTRLQTLLPSRLDRQRQHGEERRKEQRTTSVNGRSRIRLSRIDSYNWCTESCKAIHKTRDTCASATVGSWEDLGRVGVENACTYRQQARKREGRGTHQSGELTVEDILEQRLERRECKLKVRIRRDSEDIDEDAGHDSCKSHGAFAADVLDVDGEASDD